MTIAELIHALQQYPMDLTVEVDIHDHCGSDYCSHPVKGVDDGFAPSGVISLMLEKDASTC